MRPAKTFFDVYLAQLNYSVLCHLCAAYDLRHSPSTAVTEFDRFTHYIIRLCAAMDVADEMLDRHNSTFSGTNPWGGAVQARQQWRSANPNSFRTDLQHYRHQLVHSGPVMAIGGPSGIIVPRVGSHANCRDWRSLIPLPKRAVVRRDFRTTEAIMHETWIKTLRYIERYWRWMLLQKRVRVKLAPLAPAAAASTPSGPVRTTSLVLSTTYYPPRFP